MMRLSVGSLTLVLLVVGCAQKSSVRSAVTGQTSQQDVQRILRLEEENARLQQRNQKLEVERVQLHRRLVEKTDELESLQQQVAERDHTLNEKEKGILAYHEEVARLRDRLENRENSSPSTSLPVEDLTPARESGSRSGPYQLRIIALPRNPSTEKIVRDIAERLEDEGIGGIRCRTSGRYWVIDIGSFDSPRSRHARLLKDRIRSMTYEGRQQFSSAYFVKNR